MYKKNIYNINKMKQDINLNNHQFIFPIYQYDKEKKEYYLTSKIIK